MRELPNEFASLGKRAEEIFEYTHEWNQSKWQAANNADCGFLKQLSFPCLILSILSLIVLYIMTGGPTPGWWMFWTGATCVGFFILFLVLCLFDQTGKNRDKIIADYERRLNSDPQYVAANLISCAVYNFGRLTGRYSEVAESSVEKLGEFENAGAQHLHAFLMENFGLVSRAVDYYLAREKSTFDKYEAAVNPNAYFADRKELEAFVKKSDTLLDCPSLEAIGQLTLVAQAC